ncbi:MAG: omptin family outer membrane protease [Treponema sp.]|nr:omptin family outer membrane protease [Treponema sp.]
MKRSIFLTAFLILIGFHAFSDTEGNAKSWAERNLSCSFTVNAGGQSSMVKEFVYYGNGDVMSRLDWNSWFSPCIALGGSLGIMHIVLDAGLLTVIPIKNGAMEDWDYLKSDRSLATNFSRSELIMNKHYELEAKVGYEFLPGDFRIVPQIGFRYYNQKMEASGGYLQYGSLDNSNGGYWSQDLKKYPLTGTVITYEQQFLMPFVSLGAEYRFLQDWHIKLSGRWYPYVKCDSIDMHNERATQFNDFMTGGNGFMIGTEVQWRKWAVSFCCEWVKCSTGTTTQRNFGHETYLSASPSTPGTESSSFTFMVTYFIK